MKNKLLVLIIVLISNNSYAQKIGEKKTIAATMENYSCGDGCNFDFKDMISKKNYSFATYNGFDEASRKQWQKAKELIENSCDGENSCQYNGKIFNLIIQFKLVNEYEWDGEQYKKSKQKIKKWVLVGLKFRN